MKKVLFLAAAFVACVAFSSCKKSCTCTDSVSGVSESGELDGEYDSCEDLADAMNEMGMGYVNFTCE